MLGSRGERSEDTCKIMSKDILEEIFPSLNESVYSITSEESNRYNCIAWALHHTTQFWDPGMIGVGGYYWPPGVAKDDSVKSWIRVFEIHGYKPCRGDEPQPGIEKIAIYGKSNGDATHVARQLPSGELTSKLGKLEDIQHHSLGVLEGVYDSSDMADYGVVIQIMSRSKVESPESEI